MEFENKSGQVAGLDIPSVVRNLAQQALSKESRQQWSQDARTFVKEHPVQAAGVVALGATVLWAFLGTKSGRHFVKTSVAIATPLVSGWLAENAENLI